MKTKKNKLINLLKIGILFLGISLLLYNCEKQEDYLTSNQNSSIPLNLIKEKYNKQFNFEKFNSYKKEPLWNNLVVSKLNDIEYYEIPLRDFKSIDLAKSTSISYDKLIAFKNEKTNELELNIIHFYAPDKNTVSSQQELTFNSIDTFSGFLTFYDLNKNLIKSNHYINGEKSTKKYSVINKHKSNNDLFPRAPDEGECETVEEVVYTRHIWFWKHESGRIEIIDQYITSEMVSYQVCDNSEGWGNSPNGGSTYVEEEIEIVDQIVNALTGKANCVYQELQNNDLLKKTLQRFKGKTPNNLIWKQKSNLREDDKNSNSPLVNGKTYYGESYNITIFLNTEQSINRPSLAVARTILHEAIHADIYRKIKENGGLLFSNGSWLINSNPANFRSLFNAYNEDPKNPYHNYMAKHYREALESGLKEYATSIGEKYSDQFYKDMAWAGLLDTEAWKKQYADAAYAEKEKKRIQKVIQDYRNSGNNECK